MKRKESVDVQKIVDMGLLIRRLIASPYDADLKKKALDYLKRNKLLGSPLRKDEIRYCEVDDERLPC